MTGQFIDGDLWIEGSGGADLPDGMLNLVGIDGQVVLRNLNLTAYIRHIAQETPETDWMEAPFRPAPVSKPKSTPDAT